MKGKKNALKSITAILFATIMIMSFAVLPSAAAQEPTLILDLAIPGTARVVDYDDGTYVVGTSDGELYVINDDGEHTITHLGAGRINDVRIENGFIAVAAGNTVIELSLDDLTPEELWRTTSSDWKTVVSTDLSEDGNYVTYLAQRYPWYMNAGEVGVLSGEDGSLISRCYTSGYSPTNYWLDATGDMEYIAVTHPTYPLFYRMGVGLYRFDGSDLTLKWWTFLIAEYDVTEVRISEDKDYVAAATPSGTEMCLLDLATGSVLWRHNTPPKEQFACDGDDNLDYIIGATQAWSSPYPWFILRNLGTSYEVLAEGTMNGRISDLDSNDDASLIAFGSDAGEFILLERTGDSVETVFSESGLPLIDAIEIGSNTLLVGGRNFIHLYVVMIPATIDFDPDTLNLASKGKWITCYIELPVGYDADDIDISTILLNDAISAEPKPTEIGDYDEDGTADLMVKFSRDDVGALLSAGDEVELMITGELIDRTPFEGSDTIRVTSMRG